MKYRGKITSVMKDLDLDGTKRRQFYTKKIGPLTQIPEREGISAVNYARYQNGYTMGKLGTIFQK